MSQLCRIEIPKSKFATTSSEMEDEEDPPLAVEIGETITAAGPHEDEGVSVGVTVITGYLGAGKSTVNYSMNLSPPHSSLEFELENDDFCFFLVVLWYLAG